MLMKYKGFKQMTKNDMKQVLGGVKTVGGGGGEETYKCCVIGSTTDCGNSCSPHPNCKSNAEQVKC